MDSEEFYSRLKGSVEGCKYLKLVRKEPSNGKFFEVHHIHPKSMGGEDTYQNTVKLTVLEHCIAHTYLAKAIPCYYTLKPILLMSGGQFSRLSELDKITLNDVYGWADLREKAIHCPHTVKQNMHISSARKGQRCNNIGTVWIHKDTVNKRVLEKQLEEYLIEGWVRGRKKESLDNISKSCQGRKSPMKGKHHSVTTKARISAACKGRVGSNTGKKFSEERRRKMSEQKKGRVSPRKGKHLSEETRRKISEARKGQPSNTRGRIRINNGTLNKLVRPEELYLYLDKGWFKGQSEQAVLRALEGKKRKKAAVLGERKGYS